MNSQANEIKKDLLDYLNRHSREEKIDELIVEQLATYIHVFYEMQKEVLKKGGAVQVYKTGASNVSGNFVAMNKAMDYIINLSYKVGIYEIVKSKLHQYGKITEEANEFLK